MPTPDIEAHITHHKVQVDAADNVRPHFVTAGEGPKAALVIHGALRTWNAFRHLVSPPVDAGCRLVIPDHGGADAGGGAAAAGKRKDCEGRCRLPVYYRYAVRDGTASSAELRHAAVLRGS
jgi:hypothetical protein